MEDIYRQCVQAGVMLFNTDMDLNSRKRKIEFEESNDEDGVSEKSEAIKSYSSTEENSSTYGLRYDYLKSLGIIPPIEKWIYVCNFRCDKTELKEVLELAGNVITCAVFTKAVKTAKVMYSHPLEAVQAVSMLNGQIFYGQRLHVSMLNCPSDTVILPKGLHNVGPGLGVNGKPLRDIVEHYKKYLRHEVSSIDETLFINGDDIMEDRIKDEGKPENNANDLIEIESNEDLMQNKRAFKVMNVEDLPDEPSNSSGNENKVKKVKRDSEVSDQESEDGKWEKRSNASNEAVPQQAIVVSPRQDVNEETIQPNLQSQNSPISDNSRSTLPPGTYTGAQNYRPQISHSLGPQRAPNPVRGPCPPMIGPLTGASGPFVPSIRPLGPPPVPTGPAPAHRSSRPPAAAIRPPMAHMGHQVALMSRMNSPSFSAQIQSSPFQPSAQMQNPNLVSHSMIDTNVSGLTTLAFGNLPPSTTFPLLCEKISQFGQVLSLQLTTPGCALARFAHRSQSDRCVQFFHGKFIDGHMIEVRYA